MSQTLPVTSFSPRRSMFISPWREVASWSGILPICFSSRVFSTAQPLGPCTAGVYCQEGISVGFSVQDDSQNNLKQGWCSFWVLCPASPSQASDRASFLCGINTMIHPEPWPLLRPHTGTSDLKPMSSLCPCPNPGPCLVLASTKG